MKRKPILAALCALMAALFIGLEVTPAVSALSAAAGEETAETKQILQFEDFNPVRSYDIAYGGTYKGLDLPEKIRAVIELPSDTPLSTFKDVNFC